MQQQQRQQRVLLLLFNVVRHFVIRFVLLLFKALKGVTTIIGYSNSI